MSTSTAHGSNTGKESCVPVWTILQEGNCPATSSSDVHATDLQTFIKIYIVKRTNKAEIRPEEQSEKAESRRGEERGSVS